MLLGECDNEYGSQKGEFPLKYVLIDAVAEKVSNKQKLMQKMKLLKTELASTKEKRTQIQEEVKLLREEKEKLVEDSAPVIFSLRSKDDLILHLIQIEMELLLLSNGIGDYRTCNNLSLQELQRFKETIEASDLDPLKTSLLDRTENLRIKTGFVRSPIEDTINSCKSMKETIKLLLSKLRGDEIIEVVNEQQTQQQPQQPQPPQQLQQQPQQQPQPPQPQSQQSQEKRKFVFGVKPSITDLKNVQS